MSIGNPSLSNILARRGSPQELLAALAEWGILVAVRPDRSVVLGTNQNRERVLLGYTGPAAYALHRGGHTLSPCDADTILDIQRVTGVRELVIDAAGPAAAAVPIDHLRRFLEERRGGAHALFGTRSSPAPSAYATGAMATVTRTDTAPPPQASVPAPIPPLSPAPARPAPSPAPATSVPASTPPVPWVPAPRPHLSGAMQVVDPGYRRTNHPILPALRVALAELLRDYPSVHHVWISEARTVSGSWGIMLGVKVHGYPADDVVKDLHRRVRARLPQLAASGAPVLMARVADANTERRMIEIGAHVVFADTTG
ncbi:hypothetical protein TBS_35530 [Thermobispora bispora]|uniref:Uncharacterized protein n=1 Tax=Thermobispora bispora (strain ATCC 19993 / DSM 43833 / CBS 139.67 / JCM 10125 / KCTC 9307 / NBRC 14880 / R51) TaxID=469371 RepID=D6Y698_THEBD|nr:hypothetical protein [Thermobispora bispora]ADG89514.1 hypothetical protein Tbis_2815 [Thermobispora bispora DSM 43833]MBO2476012.1 hypothetical protein [Actinomycetales bacterium]MDI9581356.1 hypothetical protein [Thermobispora sp.]QSI49141.1 hypothetical protein CYL17_15845 [Thermobispora bispora]